jgi:uncharacterized membrane protein YbhN (UPF0104 family)
VFGGLVEFETVSRQANTRLGLISFLFLSFLFLCIYSYNGVRIDLHIHILILTLHEIGVVLIDVVDDYGWV